jgi:hypothetical protein
VDEWEHDGPLVVLLAALRLVHQCFLDHDYEDIRELIVEVQREVMPRCMVAFSFLEQVMP